MDCRNTILAMLFAALAAAARADAPQSVAVPHPSQNGIMRRGPFAPPDDPFHDSYKKNTGQINTEKPRPIRNIRAKISAARAARLKAEIDRERAFRSPISCYSNTGTTTAKVTQAPPQPSAENKSITICNSSVVINQ